MHIAGARARESGPPEQAQRGAAGRGARLFGELKFAPRESQSATIPSPTARVFSPAHLSQPQLATPREAMRQASQCAVAAPVEKRGPSAWQDLAGTRQPCRPPRPTPRQRLPRRLHQCHPLSFYRKVKFQNMCFAVRQLRQILQTSATSRFSPIFVASPWSATGPPRSARSAISDTE